MLELIEKLTSLKHKWKYLKVGFGSWLSLLHFYLEMHCTNIDRICHDVINTTMTS